jgi:hypothetical protein
VDIQLDLHSLTDHPAVVAWLQVQPAGVTPDRIDVLKERADPAYKSAVYRLVGAHPTGCSVVAKRCHRATAWNERLIYEQILARLAVPSLDYYGFFEESNGESCWLFLEDAGGQRYSPDLAEHRILAARWVGLLHTCAERIPATSRLPVRGASHYLEHLQGGRNRILSSLDNPMLTADDLTVLDAIVSQLNRLESHWGEITAFCERTPKTLVHGDLKAKNARIRPGKGGTELLLFDWETAGYGTPAADVGRVDVPAYHSVIQDVWPDLDAQDIDQLAHYGKIIRYVAGVDWESTKLEYQWLERVMRNMRIYESRLWGLIQVSEWRM